jgi:membrane associated rhomboid family serine protease
MIPLSDGIPARRFPIVNVALIVACFAVWLVYELPDVNAAVGHASFYPCSIDGSCRAPEPWGVSWFTAMFLHGSWDHILGNMLFLAVFGKNVEDRLGHLGYLVLYLAGGFVATTTQTAMTLLAGTHADAAVPTLGASGAIAAVLGAYFVFYPNSRVLTLHRGLGVLARPMHPHAAVDRLAAAVHAALRTARALPQLKRDVAAVDPDRGRAHQAELARLRGRLDVHLVDLDLGACRGEHVACDVDRRLEVAVGPAAADARGEIEEEKVDSKHWVLAVHLLQETEAARKGRKAVERSPTLRQPV